MKGNGWGLLALLVASTVAQAQSQQDEPMERMVITSTREAKPLVESPEAVGLLSQEALETLVPGHPADALNRIPGVYVNELGGEGHMTAIRQPITTTGVYLYLEDGIPTRPTGFFNHNALYEVNVPQSGRLEVIKGPPSALYGSDGIGGVINAFTRAPSADGEADITLELGEYGWRRALLGGSTGVGQNHALRGDLNLTDNTGWREQTEYSRLSLTGRLDSDLSSGWQGRSTLSYAQVEQRAASSLEWEDYQNNPTKNLYHGDVGKREVEAVRLASAWSRSWQDGSLTTLTPFARYNRSQMTPSWMASYDPNYADTEFASLGLMAKQRWRGARTELILGADLDYTDARYQEEAILVSKEGDIFTGYQRTGTPNYDFDAAQWSISPYLHGEWQASEHWRLSAGLRYDHFRVDYHDRLAGREDASDNHYRAPSQVLNYDNWTPKLGATYQFSPAHHLYLSYRHAFRAPTVDKLFRSGRVENSTELQPVTAANIEGGVRGRFGQWLDYELSLYDMTVENEIVNYIDGDDRKTTNAGETRHRGIELGLDIALGQQWQLGLAFTVTDQEYVDYSYVLGYFDPGCSCFVQETLNFAGNQIGRAPKTLGNASLAYFPDWLSGARAELEWVHVGEYYTDETNTQSYDGHDLLNLRLNYELNAQWRLHARLLNLTDERYSTNTTNQVGAEAITYRPGAPRSLFVGVRYQWP
ncbi:TonB-dependent receptor [Ferrimonas marina]|uniref:Outer membrane receptor proteins, mostly Fe transport n=1 Tax=Ferrimonas marina TaxID=299255 RepID=A0A1M5XCY7_9GAMM|nr:TonB-dependent receptor [Ferrimonas marina]SHH97374.1 Outer membrane receptor proteins, mostly Fe transport [Ferrimonas marina]